MNIIFDIAKTTAKTWGTIASKIDENFTELVGRVGNLAHLTTTAKSDIVSAINEVKEGQGGGGAVDTYMSGVSENAVQNKVIKAYVDGLAQKTHIAEFQGAESVTSAFADASIINILDNTNVEAIVLPNSKRPERTKGIIYQYQEGWRIVTEDLEVAGNIWEDVLAEFDMNSRPLGDVIVNTIGVTQTSSTTYSGTMNYTMAEIKHFLNQGIPVSIEATIPSLGRVRGYVCVDGDFLFINFGAFVIQGLRVISGLVTGGNRIQITLYITNASAMNLNELENE